MTTTSPHSTAATSTAPAGAVCGKHPGSPAVATCDRCGDFCCAGCREVVRGNVLCPACTALPGAAKPRIENPLPRLWQLPLRPETFFAVEVRFSAWTTALAAYVVGIRWMLVRLEILAHSGLFTGAEALEEVVGSRFGMWLTVLAVGAVVGLLYYYAGGLWYALRLRWSGVHDADHRGARELNIFSDLVVDIPYALLGVVAILTRGTLHEAWTRDWQHTPYLFNALALLVVVTSYRGARARYGPRRNAGALWFLVLPALYQLLRVALVSWLESSGLLAQ